MALKMGVDPGQLDEAGWGVIFGEAADPALEDALGPLLELRQAQAGALFRRLTVQPGEDAASFLGRHGAGSPPIIPEMVPYYLLIVASPQAIPFEFQARLAVEYAVGRIHFDALADYAAYAQRVVEVEAGGITLPRRATLCSVATPGDEISELTVSGLVEPLSRTLAADQAGWQISTVFGQSATKARLGDLLGGPESPALLLLSGHGLGVPAGDPRQRALQGALVCADWPGPPEPVQAGHYFTSEDLVPAELSGLIAVQLGSYSAGTPGPASADDLDLPGLETLRDQAFVAALPQRLLARGALAVLGHAAEVWSYFFLDRFSGPWPSVWGDVLRALMAGKPIGFALDPVQAGFAEVASNLSRELEEVSFAVGQGDLELVHLWALYRDLSSLTLLGDPAVRLPVSGAVSADLEIRLERDIGNVYGVELRFLLSGTDAPVVSRVVRRTATFDFDRLDALDRSGDMAAYGRELGKCLLEPGEVRDLWTEAGAMAWSQHPPVPLRLRLHVDPSAPELSRLRWELLQPSAEPGVPVAADERVIFSRQLTSSEWRPVSASPGDTLRVLVVVASPTALSRLPALNVVGEVALAKGALGSLPATILSSQEDSTDLPTPERLYSHLRASRYSILYLVCHVTLSADGLPLLWLEDAQGEPSALSGEELVTRLARLDSLPPLVILGSRHSQIEVSGPASRSGQELLGRLASSLVQAGIPAVVSLGKGLSEETAARFLSVLFQELQRHGTIDRAMSAARHAVPDRPDWGLPVLFMRLTSGQLFFRTPGSAARPAEVEADKGAQALPAEGEIDLRALRNLLMAAFSAQDLVRLCSYTSNPALRPVADQFSPADGLSTLAEKALTYCEKRGLLPDLLEEVRRENPRQYARFEPKLR